MTDPAALSIELLEAFARRTGLVGDAPPARYLWTDAFATCAYLGHYRRDGRPEWLDRATALVDQTHRVLGRHRPDDARTGWISGLSETDGGRHPTISGLRIGKPLPERGPEERFDRELEWERDGQYYHYLTRWIHALTRLAEVVGGGAPVRHAAELASAAQRGFAHTAPDGDVRLYWKMSIELDRPLLPAMGQHDALDGLVALAGVAAARRRTPEGLEEAAAPRLRREIRELAAMCRGRAWATDDPLGIGGLLVDAFLLARLLAAGDWPEEDHRDAAVGILEEAIVEAGRSLVGLDASPALRRPADRRPGFRELGLSLGLAAADTLRLRALEAGAAEDRIGGALDRIEARAGLRTSIHGFWLEPAHRDTPLWLEHRDINDVMLAASLDPGGYLGIESSHRPA